MPSQDQNNLWLYYFTTGKKLRAKDQTMNAVSEIILNFLAHQLFHVYWIYNFINKNTMGDDSNSELFIMDDDALIVCLMFVF